MRRLLDAILRPYAKVDFATTQRARFIALVFLALMVIVPVAAGYNAWITLTSPSFGHAVNEAIMATLGVGFVILCGALFLLARGFFTLATHLFLITAFSVFWTIMFVDRATPVARLDTIVFVLAFLTMVPLSLKKRGWGIGLYALGNIAALFVFILSTRSQLDAPSEALLDYVANSTSAIIIVAVVGWAFFAINNAALDRATSDIEARKRAEAEVTLKNALLEAQAEASNDGVLFVDGDGHVILHNRRFMELWGVPPEVMAARSDSEALAFVRDKLRDSDGFLRGVAALYEQHSTPSRDEIELADGRTLERYTEPVHDPYGKYIGRVWYFRDITARKQDEQRLRASEARYRGIVEGQTDMIFRFGSDGVISFANGALERYCRGRVSEVESLVGRDVRTLDQLPGQELLSIHMTTLKRDSTIEEFDHSFVGADGVRRWSVWSVRALRDQQGSIDEIQVVGRDISERKEAEQERERLQDQLRHAQKMESIGRLAGGVAHDFNNLLTAILGNIQLALMDMQGGRSPRECLGEASKAGHSAAALTRQLLAFSRKQLIEPRVLDLNQLIEQLQKMLARLIGEDVALQAVIDSPVGLVKADPTQLEQVLVNLAVNARDAMPDGGKLTIETADVVLDADFCRLHPEAKPGPHVLLSVSDTGSGMTPEVRSHLFEPFFTTKPKGKGTGLGLATVYGTVAQQGGCIDVESEPGKGSIFKIYLPRAEGAADGDYSPSRVADLPTGSETILLVEDEPLVLAFAREILSRLGYNVIDFGCAEDALARAGEALLTAPLLVTDVVLPGQNGRALSKKLTEANPKLKTLFASGYADDVIGHHGMLEEGVLFIAKPYTAGALARKVRAVLDGTDGATGER